jgi:hypothetical protein
MSVLIGHDEAGQPVIIGDEERQSGLYVLGKSGTGKSTLLTTMIAQDIANGHGVFFLDPHGEAIDDLLSCADYNRLKNDAYILDPEDEKYSFGINLLSCKNIHSLKARTETYTRAYDVFTKLWEEKEQEWGVWLQAVVQNILYVFIENQDYTMAEMPLFLRDKTFRNMLLANMQYNPRVVEYWKHEYSERQAQPFITRLRMLLSHPYVDHIISQKETTIDFDRVMSRRKILLVKLSVNLPADIKKFIGTILLSELTHAALTRVSRRNFCIYVDEIQNFATSDDFAKLFTQARKFGIATTIAHQERYGQFADNKKMQGATAAAANKIFFQTTVRDAEELAKEFSNLPQQEVRLEQVLVTCKEPFWDLIRRGHVNPRIQQIVNKHLQKIPEDLQRIREEMEMLRLLRTDYQDEAALYRDQASIYGVEERWAGLRESQSQGSMGAIGHSALDKMGSVLERAMTARSLAKEQIDRIETLLMFVQHNRNIIKEFDKFLIPLMDGRVEPVAGEEQFAEFLVYFSLDVKTPLHLSPIYRFYITLSYGDPCLPRTIPGVLALKYWPKQVEEVYVQKQLEILAKSERITRAEAKQKGRKVDEQHLIEYHKRFLTEAVANLYTGHTRSEGEFIVLEVIPPDLLPRVLTEHERMTIRNICYTELKAGLSSNIPFEAITDAIEFCRLLNKPENHIKVPGGQYIEKVVYTRPVRDMSDEVAQELINLPRFSAFVKLTHEQGDTQHVFKGKMKTDKKLALKGIPTMTIDLLTRFTRIAKYVKLRYHIEEEARARLSAWREPPSTSNSATPDDEPPTTSS